MKKSTYKILSVIPFVSSILITTGNYPMPFSGIGTSKIPKKALEWMHDHPDEVLTINIFNKL